jgi:hypothetical protein
MLNPMEYVLWFQVDEYLSHCKLKEERLLESDFPYVRTVQFSPLDPGPPDS